MGSSSTSSFYNCFCSIECINFRSYICIHSSNSIKTNWNTYRSTNIDTIDSNSYNGRHILKSNAKFEFNSSTANYKLNCSYRFVCFFLYLFLIKFFYIQFIYVVRTLGAEFAAKPRERGNLGRPIQLFANHFAINLKKPFTVYQYDVEVTKLYGKEGEKSVKIRAVMK